MNRTMCSCSTLCKGRRKNNNNSKNNNRENTFWQATDCREYGIGCCCYCSFAFSSLFFFLWISNVYRSRKDLLLLLLILHAVPRDKGERPLKFVLPHNSFSQAVSMREHYYTHSYREIGKQSVSCKMAMAARQTRYSSRQAMQPPRELDS